MTAPPALPAAAGRADRELADIAAAYELLRVVQPENVDEAWEEFRSARFQRIPEFRYPEVALDASDLRRRLDRVDLTEVEDPALRYLLMEKREEIAREIALIEARDTPAFLATSMALFGPAQQPHLAAAEEIVGSPPSQESHSGDDELDARRCRGLIDDELDHYRSRDPTFSPNVEVADQPGFIASGGDLLFPKDLCLAPHRARALVQHEVGVHIVTYHNGSRQPLRLLMDGLSSYDEIQEAFGALAEYLVGGFSTVRLRTLAARLLAVGMVEDGADFLDVFHRLTKEAGFGDSASFQIAARICVSGGFTRDQIYLRGLMYLIEYLQAGGEVEPLYVGKVGHRELSVIRTLMRRGILSTPALVPRFLEMHEGRERLDSIRAGLGLQDLAQC